MKLILNIIFIAALTANIHGQGIDKDRMHRDLEVAENALGTVLTPESNEYRRFTIRDRDIDAGYIKDYGVIFTVSKNGFGQVKVFETTKAKNVVVDTKTDLKEAKEKEKHHFIENTKTFLADYASIIGQLSDNDKISVRWGGTDSHSSNLNLEPVYFTNTDGNGTHSIWSPDSKYAGTSEIIVEATVSNINALRKGSMTRDAFFKSVSVTENEMSYEKDADLETLTAMFHRLYKKDLSDTYYSERMPKYSKLSNFGVIVKMKFYSSYEDNHVYSMPTIDKKGLSLEERNNHVMELLPKFEADFKENLVNYARTLKNLDTDEILMFEINMTTCKGCKDFPKVMKYSIKKSVLHKFNRGEISMQKAMDLVDVDRIVE